MKKSKTRIFVGKTISSNLMVYIKDKQHHFLKNVLRIKINDLINIFDGKTGEWQTKVISINRNNTVLYVINSVKKMIKSPDIWLIFSPIKQHRMSIAIQKATELGVSRLIPCITEYSNIKTINFKNLHANVIEAAEQSDRLDIPEITKTVNLNSLLLEWPGNRNLIFCDTKINYGKKIIETILSSKNNNKEWAVLIGPEGGFSDLERELISHNRNILPVSLGDRLLRSDTAITVSLYCIQELIGK